MRNIIQLSDETISRIAAGEVIERPSYAVKELVENAIDAHPSRIDVTIVDSGLTEITVVDDGIGIPKEDIAIALLPHTTSKIIDSDDLLSVSTLGFRGEGLSSIVALAHVVLASRPKNARVGYEIEAIDGKLQPKKEVGMAEGTRISAFNLMHNLPARKKFLKSERTEFRHIVEYLSEVSLSYPSISFTLTHNGKQILNISGDRESRISELLGETVARRLMTQAFKNTITEVEVYVSHPENSLPSKNKLYIYINNRPVSDGVITAAIKEAYGKLLDPYSYPVGAIFITIPVQFVDVNVHPTKREVRFESADHIFQEIVDNTRELLSSYNLTFGTKSLKATSREIAADLREDIKKLSVSKIRSQITPDEIVIIDNTYIVTAHTEGLILYDQHAAHEALLFDAFSESFKKHRSESTLLDESILIKLTKAQSLAFEEHSELFQKMGFQIEAFGGDTIKVMAIPKLVNEHNIASHIAEILEYVTTEQYPDIDHLNNKMIAFLSCKSAIKAGDRITTEEAQKLITELNEHPTLYTCPHGRPVKRILSVHDLQKMFKRV